LDSIMNERTVEQKRDELNSLDQAHIQNETARDSFIGLGHTALLAASISFVGDVVPLADALCMPALILSWLAGIVGLLSLAMSFEEARRAIDRRRQAINDFDAPDSVDADKLNRIALWTFPVALITLFVFVTANVVRPMSQNSRPPNDPRISTHGMSPPPRSPAVMPTPRPNTGVVPAPQAPVVAPSPPPTPKK
jgi:hypothetical protein